MNSFGRCDTKIWNALPMDRKSTMFLHKLNKLIITWNGQNCKYTVCDIFTWSEISFLLFVWWEALNISCIFLQHRNWYDILCLFWIVLLNYRMTTSNQGKDVIGHTPLYGWMFFVFMLNKNCVSLSLKLAWLWKYILNHHKKQRFTTAFIHAYVHTHIHTYSLHTCIRTYAHTDAHSYIHVCCC